MTGLPLVEELSPCSDVMSVVRALSNWPRMIVLDSALRRAGVGRHSFVAADPYRVFEIARVSFGDDPFVTLRAELERCATAAVPGLPPFQGGAAGLLSYELGRAWERLPPRQIDEFELPDLAVGLYDWVIAWDHAVGKAWIVSQGFPETDPARRAKRAAARLEEVKAALRGRAGWRTQGAALGSLGAEANDGVEATALQRGDVSPLTPAPLPRKAGGEGCAPAAMPQAAQYPSPGLPDLTSSFSRDGYLQAVARVIEYIRAGDIFQANLSQRLLAPLSAHPLELFARLRERNPAPFAGYLAGDDWAVASASPERFVCVRDEEVETRPIKGTRRRRSLPEADLFTGDELRESEKDRAENVMIVDLLRNDLSRVCEPGTVRVPRLCAVETYETVQHLVSEIRGRLSPGKTFWDLLAASFPGGSITGAPKVRAMEIIRELEPTVRGPYCGSLFYCGFDGTADSSLLIRTLVCRGGWAQCSVGGGIVAQSDPVAEYEETLHKAEGMLRAL